MTTKLNYFTERVSSGFTGRCKQMPTLSYGPKKNRDTALSGIKRLVKRTLKAGAAVQQTTPPPAPTVTLAPKKNLIRIVVDRSGSMQGLEQATAKALNANIETLKQQSKLTGQDTLLEVVTFDSPNYSTSIDVIRTLQNVQNVAPITEREVWHRGGTPLLEATGESILQLERFPVGPREDVAYIVMVITDGENTDHRGTFRTEAILKATIDRVQRTDKWTVTFLTPPGKKDALVRNLGVPAGNVQEWEASVQGIESYAASNNAGFASYFSARSLGATKSTAFYTTDLSNISTKDVKKALQDLSGQFKVLTVKAEADIKPFVEGETGRPYVPGTAFYQLTKDEKKIQSYKELLVMEKGKKEIYGGPGARGLLGLPVNQDVKVRPGNHANFDLFVQSTSVNRKLVRGTKLLVKN